MIVIVMGLPGSGKSYFASRLASTIKAGYLSSDRLRKKMISKKTYSSEEKQLVYDEMLEQVRQAVKKKKDLVLDATFYKKAIRKKFMDEAEEAGGVVFIEIMAPEIMIKKRVSRKRKDSDAGFDVYKIIKKKWEPLREKHLILESTSSNINNMMEAAKSYLHNWNDKATD